MNRTWNETLDLDRPAAHERETDPLAPHLIRIVRRALRHPTDRSPLACAVRAAANQFDPGPLVPPTMADELRVRQVARRMAALLAADFRDPAGPGARLETVCA